MLLITLQNIGGGEVADYDWHVYVNRREIAAGQLRGHNRANGWAALVAMLADQQLAQAADGDADKPATGEVTTT